jgi:hypothetical protein
MAIVMWIYEDVMFCVPLYTWNKRGIWSRPAHLQPEYVALRHYDDDEFENQGEYKPIVARSRKDFDPNCSVHLTGAIPVKCEEDVGRAGRVTEESFAHLWDLWESLHDKAKRQRY